MEMLKNVTLNCFCLHLQVIASVYSERAKTGSITNRKFSPFWSILLVILNFKKSKYSSIAMELREEFILVLLGL